VKTSSPGPGSSGGAPGRRAFYLAAALLLTVPAILYYTSVWRSPADFARSLDDGDLLSEDFTEHIYPTAEVFYTTGMPARGYYYSAFFGLLVSPLGALPPEQATAVWTTIQFLLTFMLLLVPLRRFVVRAPSYGLLYYVLLISSLPVLHNFRWGQVSVLMALLVIASQRLYSAGRILASAAVLALAAAIKYYPAVFALMYIYCRDRKALAAFAGFLAGFLLAPALVLSPRGLFLFEREAVGSVLYSPWVARSMNSMHFPHVLLRLVGLQGSSGALVLLTVLGLAVTVAVFMLLTRRRRLSGKADPELFVCSALLCLPFFLRTSWPHYFAFLPFCQVTVLVRLAGIRVHRTGSRTAIILLAGASIVLSNILFFDLVGSWQTYSSLGFLLLADLLLLAAFVLEPADEKTAQSPEG
jgi:hypothetical protein